MPEPFSNAWDTRSFSMRPGEVERMLGEAGFADGAGAEIELVTHWPDLDHLVDVVRGSPFAPVLAGFDAARQDEALRRLPERYGSFAKGNLVEVPTYATVARAVAES
ncbi:MAG: hypothetical protein M3070_06795 [Actinomycetota bacterium]|nr:hypothetical protein [Actinomycetota bacterium]